MPGLFQRWFGVRETYLCPFCLGQVDFEKSSCESCKNEIPSAYRNNVKDAPPVSAFLAGAAGHGKTVLLDSIALTLEAMTNANIWPGLIIEPANERTHDWLARNRDGKHKGEPPLPTAPGLEQSPIMLLLRNIPLWGSRYLILRDSAGEDFQNFAFAESQREFCKRSPCAILVLDVERIAREPALAMHTLFSGYIRTLVENGCNVKGESRKVLVVLSKGDQLQHDPNQNTSNVASLPLHLGEYLANCPVRNAFDLRQRNEVDPSRLSSDPKVLGNYLAAIKQLDEMHLRKWVSQLEGGNQLLALAKEYNVDLRFTLNSGWGENPDLNGPYKPKRVLDSILWLLEFHSTKA